MPREPKSVLQPWVSDLTLQQQGTLLAAIRGPDGVAMECVAKDVVRAFRATIMRNALTPQTSKFQGDGTGIPTRMRRDPSSGQWLGMSHFFSEVDALPHHWLLHMVHAAEIVGYEHPSEEVASFWYQFYLSACDDMHLNPETSAQMRGRLSGDGPELPAAEVGTAAGLSWSDVER